MNKTNNSKATLNANNGAPYLIKFLDNAVEIAQKLPEYSSPFSNRLYTQRQHFCLLLLKQELSVSYRRLASYIRVMPPVAEMLGLERVPHWTTLQKFCQRIELEINSFTGQNGKAVIAIDATGFRPSRASVHYMERNPVVKRRKGWMKLSIAVECQGQTIAAARVSANAEHDQRSLAETAFSAMKRLYGDYLYSCKEKMQEKELYLRVITYNIHRNVVLFVEGFYTT